MFLSNVIYDKIHLKNRVKGTTMYERGTERKCDTKILETTQ